MFLTTRGHYSTRAMLHLAQYGKRGPIPVADIAAREDISQKYLQQLLGTLKRAGLARVVLGPHGGFELARPPEEITIGAILRAAEGDISLMECLVHDGLCPRAKDCPSRRVWSAASKKLNEFLDSQTLASALHDAQLQPAAGPVKPAALKKSRARRACP
ncbi:MAG: RrF2 family transcriptional regulator [Deltaproteobacteria bacterium]|nr:RrF2 family transcriptional regulator [Deltaproteobacteria bacterium]